MAVKKATVDSVMAKVAEATDKKEAAPKAEVKKETVKKEPAKKAPAKKEVAAKTVAKKTTPATNVIIEFAGGQVATADIVAKAMEVSGKKSVKEFNVYYQPETGMVYFTADGEEGSFSF